MRIWLAVSGLLIAISLLPVGVAAQETQQRQPAADTAVVDTAQRPAGSPVRVRGRTLFYVQERVLSFSPEDRARLIANRLEQIYRDPFTRIDSVSVVEGEGTTDLVLGDVIIMSVTERDARAAGRTRAELARAYADSIETALSSLRREYSLTRIALGLLYAVLVVAVIALVLYLMGRIFPRLYDKLDSWRGTLVPALKIQRLELVSSSRITDVLIWLAKAARVVVTVALFYLSIPLLLQFFPWTQAYSARVLRYILVPVTAVLEGFLDYLPNLFFIIIIALASYYLIRFVKLVFVEIGKGTISLPGFYREWARPTFKIARFLVIAFTVVAIFPYLPGAGSDAFKGVGLFLGVLFSLGSTSAIANLVAGVVLTYTRAFDEGDRVKISDTVGDVIDRTLLATHIRTTKNVDITIPNAMVLGSHITNYSTSARTGLILPTTLTIGYDVAWRKVHELLLAAARDTSDIEADPPPFVLQTALDDHYVSYELNAYTDKPARMSQIYSDLHQNIQDRFAEAGVEIMSPHYSALRDGNRVALPDEALPRDYHPPTFRVETAPAS